MGVADVVAEVAAAIIREKSPLTPREVYLTYVLQGMPLFREIRRLDLWDKAYKEVASDNNRSTTEELIDALYWLGAECLYGAYEPALTTRYFVETLAPLLCQHGIKTPCAPDLTTW
jgi:hypothetical protein